MKIHRRASLLAVALLGPAFALANGSMSLSQAIQFVKSSVPGEVVAASLDSSGDKPMHFHIDMRLPHGALVRLEVDPATRRILSRASAAEVQQGALTISEVLDRVSQQFPGDVTRIELDDSDAVQQHYHVDVRLSNGRLARLRVDSGSGKISGRSGASFDL